jgi:Uma2 family endonuclease
MVVFGRPKGERPSYRQWEEDGISPQVVFEILSESNKTAAGRREMDRKFAFYQQYGVEEYYIYDPDEFGLVGWLRQGQQLVPIEPMSDWNSPRLRIRFAWQAGEELVLYRPDGQWCLSFVELDEWLVKEQQRAEQERQRAEQERQRAQQAEAALDEERRQRQSLLERLRELGIDPEQL